MDDKLDVALQWINEGFYINRVTKILNLERSTFYYRNPVIKEVEAIPKRGRPVPGYSITHQGSKVPDGQIEEYLMEYDQDHLIGALGYKKWTALLNQQYDLVINKKKVYRLCKGMGLLKPYNRKPKHPRRLAKNRKVTGPNQLWQIDIKYGKIVNTNYFVFVCVAIDVYDKHIVSYYRGPLCRAPHVTQMLAKAIIKRKVHNKLGEYEEKLIIRSDNGPQFVSDTFGDFCKYHKILHERIPTKTPNMNAFVESFYSRLESECFQRVKFHFYEEAYHHIDTFIHFYNNTRPHGSLNQLSPAQYYKKHMLGQVPPQEIEL